ncbi:MAG TPA: hypothetical protein PKD72_03780, partial [Gemmatales bacterium]|nr:hypothetical protein [Gemmatales bacterium]
MTFSLNANIAWRVAELLRTCGIEIDQEHRGPVLLGRLFDECGLRHAAIPHLCRRAIQAHLMEYGIVVGDLGPEEEPLSGFLFTQGPRGWA